MTDFGHNASDAEGLSNNSGGGNQGADLSGFEGSPEIGLGARQPREDVYNQLESGALDGAHEQAQSLGDLGARIGAILGGIIGSFGGLIHGGLPGAALWGAANTIAGAGVGGFAGYTIGGLGKVLTNQMEDLTAGLPDPRSPELGGADFIQRGTNDLRGSAGSDTLNVVHASFTNPPTTPGTLFRDESDRIGVVLNTGQAVPVTAIRALANTVRAGGTPGPNQRAIIEAMTPAQRQEAGIFLRPNGDVIPFADVLTRAVQNAAAGEPLTANQQTALGLVALSIPSEGGSAWRDTVNQLAGSAKGEVRDNIGEAWIDAARYVRTEVSPAARADTERQQRGTPARIASNAVGRLSEGKGLTAKQQELYDGLTRKQQAALLDQALAPKGKPKIVQNIVARVESGKKPTKAQQRYLASLSPKQRETIAEPIRKAERAATRTATKAAAQATKQRARVETLQDRQQAAKQALRQKQQAQKAAAPPAKVDALAKRQAQQRRQQAARQAQQQRQQQQRQAAARKVQAAAKASAARKAAKQKQRALLERQRQNRINVERRQAAARAATQARQRAAAAKAAQVAAKRRTQQARAVQAAAAPRNTGPLRKLPRAQQQAVLLTRAVSRRQQGKALTAAQRRTLKAAPRSARQPIARQVQAAQAARAAQQAAAQRARAAAAKAAESQRRAAVQRQAQAAARKAAAAQKAAAAKRTRAAQQKAQKAAAKASTARRKAAAPRNMPTKLKNLSAKAQQQILLTRAVARRQAGVKLTANQLRALKRSTAKQRKAVR